MQLNELSTFILAKLSDTFVSWSFGVGTCAADLKLGLGRGCVCASVRLSVFGGHVACWIVLQLIWWLNVSEFTAKTEREEKFWLEVQNFIWKDRCTMSRSRSSSLTSVPQAEQNLSSNKSETLVKSLLIFCELKELVKKILEAKKNAPKNKVTYFIMLFAIWFHLKY